MMDSSLSPSEGKLPPAVLLAWTQRSHLELPRRRGREMQWEEEEVLTKHVSWRKKGLTQTPASALTSSFLLHLSPLHSKPNLGPIPLFHPVHHPHFSHASLHLHPLRPHQGSSHTQLPQLGSLKTLCIMRDRSLPPLNNIEVCSSFSHSLTEY